MKTKQVMVLVLPLIAFCLLLANRRGYSEPVDNRIVRIAELEIDPYQQNAYTAAF